MASAVRAAGMLVYRKANDHFEYLLLQASYPPYHWTPPKGHVDAGEDEWSAAVRETKEEAGLELSQLHVHQDFEHVMRYQVKHSEQHQTDSCREKTVKYWLAGVKKSAAIELSNEHQHMQWLPLEEAIRTARFPEMATLLHQAEQHLGQHP